MKSWPARSCRLPTKTPSRSSSGSDRTAAIDTGTVTAALTVDMVKFTIPKAEDKSNSASRFALMSLDGFGARNTVIDAHKKKSGMQ